MNATTTLKHYAALVGDKSGDMDVAIVDLLADLMHFCQKNQADMAQLYKSAEMHFEAEKET